MSSVRLMICGEVSLTFVHFLSQRRQVCLCHLRSFRNHDLQSECRWYAEDAALYWFVIDQLIDMPKIACLDSYKTTPKAPETLPRLSKDTC